MKAVEQQKNAELWTPRTLRPSEIRKFLGENVFEKMEIGAAVEKTAKIIAMRTKKRFRILKAVVGEVAFANQRESAN
jgi:hypothetical protein